MSGSISCDTEAPVKVPSISQMMGEEIVTVVVGTGDDTKRFLLHKNLLGSKSHFFKTLFQSTFKEGIKQLATLPEDDPRIFALFVDWVYQDTISVLPVKDYSGARTAVRELHKLFYIADKYCLAALADLVIDSIIGLGRKFKSLPGLELIDEGYRSTAEGSKLRVYLSRSYMYQTTPNKDRTLLNNWTQENLREILLNKWTDWTPENLRKISLKHPDLLLDYYELVIDAKSSSNLTPSARHPNKTVLCDYHQHTVEEGCSSAYYNAEIVRTP